MKIFSLPFLALLFILKMNSAYSQNDWRAGYVLKTQTDTLFGFIDNKNLSSNSIQCYFRKTESDETQVFTPQDIYGYRFASGEFFISKILKIENSEQNVFLEFLIKGIVNIYHLKFGEDKFYMEKDGLLIELKNTSELTTINHVKYQKDKKEYIGILISLLNDQEMIPQINSSPYTAKSFINIAKNYHEKVCDSEDCIVFKKELKLPKFKFGFHLGEEISKFNFSGRTVTDFGFNTLVGARLEIEDAFIWRKNLNLVFDLNFRYYSNYSLYEKAEQSSSNISYNGKYYILSSWNNTYASLKKLDVDFKLLTLNLPVVLKYTFSSGKIKPYVGVGIVNNFVLSQNENFKYSLIYDKLGKSFPFYSTGLIGNGGIKFKVGNREIYLEFTYEFAQSLNMNKIFRMRTNDFGLKCGIIF